MDAATREFLELVQCDPWEVLDVPPDRRHVDPTYVPQECVAESAGTVEVHFGKHKGKTISEVPREYLEWLIQQPPMKGVPSQVAKRIEKFKDKARAYLADPKPPAAKGATK